MHKYKRNPARHQAVELPAAAGLLGLVLVVALAACSTPLRPAGDVAELPPLQYRGESIAAEAAARGAPTPDLLALDDEMRRFVATYTAGASSRRQRLTMLHNAVTGSATLGLEYELFAEGSAQDAFYSRAANCLSFANLYVALAREAGLDARYQWLDVRPQWTRMGERVAMRLHVNTLVYLNPRERLMVDLDPLPPQEVTSSREISDREVQALYHSNIAMEALAREELPLAWGNAVRALQLAPHFAHLWVNLGVIYRHAGQYPEAEGAYQTALRIDADDRSALNNLLVLYQLQDREAEHRDLLARLQRYQDENPFYHAWKGDIAGERGDWREAREHYEEALELLPGDSRLLFGLGIIHDRLGHREVALRYIQQAMQASMLQGEKAYYRARLEAIRQGASGTS